MTEIVKCVCGRMPTVVSASETMIRVSCTCGHYGAWVSTSDRAVERWNIETNQREYIKFYEVDKFN